MTKTRPHLFFFWLRGCYCVWPPSAPGWNWAYCWQILAQSQTPEPAKNVAGSSAACCCCQAVKGFKSCCLSLCLPLTFQAGHTVAVTAACWTLEAIMFLVQWSPAAASSAIPSVDCMILMFGLLYTCQVLPAATWRRNFWKCIWLRLNFRLIESALRVLAGSLHLKTLLFGACIKTKSHLHYSYSVLSPARLTSRHHDTV